MTAPRGWGPEELKALRNGIIGNKTRKLSLINERGAVSTLLKIAMESREIEEKIQAIVVLGSLAVNSTIKERQLLTEMNVPQTLLDVLIQTEGAHIPACSRSLKLFFEEPTELILNQTHYMGLIKRISETDIKVAENSARILARSLSSKPVIWIPLKTISLPKNEPSVDPQFAINCFPILLNLILRSPRSLEYALDSLSQLCRNSPAGQVLATMQFNDKPFFMQVYGYLKHKSAECRLQAASLMAILSKVHQIDNLPLRMLPCLVQLFNEQNQQERACLCLAQYVHNSEPLQKTLSEMEAISKLALMLLKTQNPKLMEAVLLALASLSSLHEKARKLIINTKTLHLVVEAMQHKNIGVRTAACQCAQSISRSVKNLRTSLVDAGVAEPLFKLLCDKSPQVIITASATICNLVLDFAPMKQTIIERGGVEQLTLLTYSSDPNIRFNCVWALKNLIYNTVISTKQFVMNNLTYQHLVTLVDDVEFSVQEQALNLFRNLACGSEQEVEMIVKNVPNLLDVLRRKLKCTFHEIVYQTLYLIVNIATGNEEHKNLMMDKIILHMVMESMNNKESMVRVAAIWVIINLTWPEENHVNIRSVKLRELQFDKKLKCLLEDQDVDVRDRARVALSQI